MVKLEFENPPPTKEALEESQEAARTRSRGGRVKTVQERQEEDRSQPKTIVVGIIDKPEGGKTGVPINLTAESTQLLRTKTDIEGRQTISRDPLTGGLVAFATPSIVEEERKQGPPPAPPVPSVPLPTSQISQAGFIDVAPESGFVGDVRAERGRLSLKKLRGERLTPFEMQEAFLLGVTESGIQTFEFGRQLLTRPKETLKNLGGFAGAFARGEVSFPEVGRALREEPEFSSGFIAGDILTGIGTAEGAKLASRGARLTTARLDPSFVKATEGFLQDIPTSRGLVDVELAGGTASTAESLQKQIALAGETVDAVSAQRGLFGRGTREIIVDKPLPTPDAPALEKSFFADPRGRLRQSRIGVVPEDILPSSKFDLGEFLTRDITLRRPRKQALIFPETPIAELPTSLQGISRKLRAGETLTPAEISAFQEFQLKPTGEFKPVGFLSRESEITLAPGEVITKEGRAGVTILGGERVDIFEAGVKTPNAKSVLDPIDLTGSTGRTTLSRALEPVVSIPPVAVGLESLRVSGRAAREFVPSSIPASTLARLRTAFPSAGSQPIPLEPFSSLSLDVPTGFPSVGYPNRGRGRSKRGRVPSPLDVPSSPIISPPSSFFEPLPDTTRGPVRNGASSFFSPFEATDFVDDPFQSKIRLDPSKSKSKRGRERRKREFIPTPTFFQQSSPVDLAVFAQEGGFSEPTGLFLRGAPTKKKKKKQKNVPLGFEFF